MGTASSIGKSGRNVAIAVAIVAISTLVGLAAAGSRTHEPALRGTPAPVTASDQARASVDAPGAAPTFHSEYDLRGIEPTPHIEAF